MADGQNRGRTAKPREDLLSDLESLSREQLETGVQDREEFTDAHLASQQRQNTAQEGSTVSRAKRHLTWALCYSSIGILIVCAAMLAYLIVNVGVHLSKTPEQASSVLWSIVTHGSVAAASLYFQKILRKNLD